MSIALILVIVFFIAAALSGYLSVKTTPDFLTPETQRAEWRAQQLERAFFVFLFAACMSAIFV